jgi:hypothetical protein
VSSLRYDLGVLSQKTAFFIVTAVKTSNVTLCVVGSYGAATGRTRHQDLRYK